MRKEKDMTDKTHERVAIIAGAQLHRQFMLTRHSRNSRARPPTNNKTRLTPRAKKISLGFTGVHGND